MKPRVKLLQRYVEKHNQPVGVLLIALVLATLAFDNFIGFGGQNLIGLRLVYLALMLMIVAYVYTVSNIGKN